MQQDKPYTYRRRTRPENSRMPDDGIDVAPPGKKPRSAYIPSLDGLRAFAVIVVVVYHMRTAWAPSGLMGVTIFFVLSGYLITGLLITEWNRSGKLDLKTFWMKRVRRLVPAILFLLACIIFLTAVFAPVMFTKLRTDLVSCLFFFNNWWQIFHDVSYFENLGSPSPVTHFWSLSIEEQFYIVWPLLLLLLFKLRSRKFAVCTVIAVLALASGIEMAVLYSPDVDPSRVYYGTDTRAFSLLIGAWLAFVFPASRIRSRKRFSDRARLAFEIGGFASLAAIIFMVLTVSAYEPMLYRGGYFLLSVLTAVVIVALVNNRGVLSRIFGWFPLVWIGQRSYGIYLWHYPLLLLMNPPSSFGETPWWAYLLQAAVILAVVEFSYRLIENPIRHGAIGKAIAKAREHLGRRRGGKTLVEYLAHRYRIQIGSVSTVIIAAALVIAFVPSSTIGNAEDYEGGEVDIAAALANGNSEGNSSDSGTQGEDRGLASKERLARLPDDVADWNILLIGDSVAHGADLAFTETFANGYIDAVSMRQIEEGKLVLDSWLSEGWNGDAVVIALGSNSLGTYEDLKSKFEEVLDSVPEGMPIFLLTLRTGGIDNFDHNDVIREIDSERDDVYLVDWYAATASHPDWFVEDYTHLSFPEGGEEYVATLIDVMGDYHRDAQEELGIHGSDAPDDSSPEDSDDDPSADDSPGDQSQADKED